MRHFRAEVSNRAVHKLKPRLNGAKTNPLDLFRVVEPFNVLVRAEVEINPVGIFNHLLREIKADKLRQIAADFIA